MGNGNILIIDDEEKLRKLLARIISLEGYQVFEAANGKAGLLLLEKEDIQLIISDVKLPDINGIALTAQIKHLSPLTEIVVLTAYGTILDGVTAIKNGAFDYEGKNIEVLGSGLVTVVDGMNISDTNIYEIENGEPFTIKDLKVHLFRKGDCYHIPVYEQLHI